MRAGHIIPAPRRSAQMPPLAASQTGLPALRPGLARRLESLADRYGPAHLGSDPLQFPRRYPDPAGTSRVEIVKSIGPRFNRISPGRRLNRAKQRKTGGRPICGRTAASRSICAGAVDRAPAGWTGGRPGGTSSTHFGSRVALFSPPASVWRECPFGSSR